MAFRGVKIVTISADCPVCGSPLVFDIRQKLELKEDLETVEELELQQVHRKIVGPTSAREQRIIEAMEIHIQEDTTIEQIHRVLREEYHVCRAHIEPMTDKIKEAYRLYSPDGRRLCPI